MKKLLLSLILLVSFLLTGCGSADEASIDGDYYGDEYSDTDTDPEPPAPNDGEIVLEGGDVVQSADVPALLNRKIIYTASLGISSERPKMSIMKLLLI
jgi:hypothetical protein